MSVVKFPAPARVQVSKSKRFDIFARDGFTCQYCGQRPPDVILEPDHIVAVANGGTNEDMNLITSCFDCNRGKRDKVLGEVHPRPDADLHWLQVAQERVEIDRYLEAKRERDAAFELLTQALCEVWMTHLTDEYHPRDRQWSIWLATYSPEEVEEAIKITASPYQRGNFSGSQPAAVGQMIRYVSGVPRNTRQRSERYQ